MSSEKYIVPPTPELPYLMEWTRFRMELRKDFLQQNMGMTEHELRDETLRKKLGYTKKKYKKHLIQEKQQKFEENND